MSFSSPGTRLNGHSRFGVPPLVARSLKPCAMVCALAFSVCASLLIFRFGVEVETGSDTTEPRVQGARAQPSQRLAWLVAPWTAPCISYVFPGRSHETRLRQQHGNLTAQQNTTGIRPNPHTFCIWASGPIVLRRPFIPHSAYGAFLDVVMKGWLHILGTCMPSGTGCGLRQASRDNRRLSERRSTNISYYRTSDNETRKIHTKRVASSTSRRAADPWNSRCVPPPGGWFLGAALMSVGAPRRLGSNVARTRNGKR